MQKTIEIHLPHYEIPQLTPHYFTWCIDCVQLQIECTTTQVMTPFPPLTFRRIFFSIRSIDPVLAGNSSRVTLLDR